MISHLRGSLIETELIGGAIEHAVIDVAGVGYLVFTTHNTAAALRESGAAEVALFIETHIREDHIHLFGFLTAAERTAFRVLSTVQGVGAKVAMAILEVLDAEKLETAILSQDKDAFTQAAGVGSKLASRIISELKDKDINLSPANLPQTAAPEQESSANAPANAPLTVIRNDSLSALTNLGYDKSQAYQAVAQILQENSATAENLSTEQCIRLALQKLAAA